MSGEEPGGGPHETRESEENTEPPGGDDWSHSDRKQKCPWCIGDMAAGDRRPKGARKPGQRERQP